MEAGKPMGGRRRSQWTWNAALDTPSRRRRTDRNMRRTDAQTAHTDGLVCTAAIAAASPRLLGLGAAAAEEEEEEEGG